MNLGRCPQGHFYDMEKFATCPHCSGGAIAGDNSMTTVFTDEMTDTVPVTEQGGRMNGLGGQPTEGIVQETVLPVAGMPADMATMPMDNSSVDTPTVPLMNSTDMKDDTELSDDDHTVAFFDDVFSNVSGKTQETQEQAGSNAAAVPAKANSVSTPCVGWLIALGGVHIGTDFRLKAGKNFIGRDSSMDIALTWDKSVSRKRHAIVVYEPKQHLYLVQPGESSGLVYRNNEVVLTPVKLEAYDLITVGEVNLLFIPLCGERFNWSTLFEEMNKKQV